MYRLVVRELKVKRLRPCELGFIGLVRMGLCSFKGWCPYFLGNSGSRDLGEAVEACGSSLLFLCWTRAAEVWQV